MIQSPEQQWRSAGWWYHTLRGLTMHPGVGFALLFWIGTAAVEPDYWWFGAIVGFVWPALVIFTASSVSLSNPPWRRWDYEDQP